MDLIIVLMCPRKSVEEEDGSRDKKEGLLGGWVSDPGVGGIDAPVAMATSIP